MLLRVTLQEPLEAIDMLQDLVTLNESVQAAVVVYLLGDILNDFNSTNMADQEQLIEVLIVTVWYSCNPLHCMVLSLQGVLSLGNTLITTTPSDMEQDLVCF